ncbi:MAG: anthranilate synthase component I [Candidatus Omnitrophota bacterium]
MLVHFLGYMYYPSLKEFLSFSKKANVIPVYKQLNADLDTPVSAYLKIRKNDYAFLLESVEGQEKIARFSFLGSNPSLIFKSKDNLIEINYSDKPTKKYITAQSPVDEIKKIMREFKPMHINGLPRFYGGLVGYMGYDTVRFFEKIPDKNPDELKLPDCVFILTDTIIIFDHVNHTLKIASNVILPKTNKKLSRQQLTKLYKEAIKKIEELEQDLSAPLDKNKLLLQEGTNDKISIESNYNKAEFTGIIKQAKTYIRKGDIIQTVLSQRFKIKNRKDPFNIYRSLRNINPSSYMFFLKLKGLTLIGASPEMLVRCEDGLVVTRPIAGTRPRGKTTKEDDALEKELLNDAKEKAEHIMLVDLGRNDLGRVCKTESVKISEFMSVKRYSHVMHLETEVQGILNKKFDSYDVLKACFPAGTVSGSPKIRAMEIIDTLEKSKRGPYAGCVGYFSFSQNMDTCITIRTIIVKDNFAYVQAGAGIVADSQPEKEYIETINKAKALIEAITK